MPAGEFWMGRTRLYLMDEIGWNLRERMDDRPVHRVSLAPFAIGALEVTNAEYAAFVATPGSGVTAPFHWGGAAPPASKSRLPIYNVTWADAAKYCASVGGRLPSEAEWERAARGGVADLDYPWGNDFVDPAAANAGGWPTRAQRRQHRAGGRRIVRAQCLRVARRVGQRVGMDGRLVRPALLQPQPGGESDRSGHRAVPG